MVIQARTSTSPGPWVRDRDRLADKYLRAAELLPGESLYRGRSPYQDFAALITMSDALVHLVPNPSPAVLRKVQHLVQKGHARQKEKYIDDKGRTREVTTSWVDQVSTFEVARWACESAWCIMKAILDRIPPTPGSEFDIFKRTFPILDEGSR